MSISELDYEEQLYKIKYFQIHYDESERYEEENSQIIDEEEEDYLINEKDPKFIKYDKSFQPINNNDSEIDKRYSNSNYLKDDVKLDFNKAKDEFLDNNQQDIIIPLEEEINVNDNNKNNNNNNYNNNINIDCIEKEKEQIFYVNKNMLFNPGANTEIRDIINDLKKPKPKKEKKKKSYYEKPFKIKSERKPKVKQKRKFKPDDIRKEIKSRFLKSLKIIINKKLVNAESELFFDYLPQCFIINVTKKGNNKSILNMTFKELMLTNFLDKEMSKIFLGKRDRNSDMKKEIKNMKIM